LAVVDGAFHDRVEHEGDVSSGEGIASSARSSAKSSSAVPRVISTTAAMISFLLLK
jgi:hypothetical protein